MTIWRLERLRLARTFRGAGLLASYAVFGVLAPIIVRYQEALFRNVGGGVKIETPPPTPAQAVTSYVGNASQIGLIVTIFIAAGSLVFDVHPEWSAFLRTRVSSVRTVVLPKFWMNAVAAAAAFTVGAILTWVLTALLIDPLPTAGMLAGIVCWWLYLGFAVSVVTLAAGLSRSVVGAAGLTVVVLVALPLGAQVVGVIEPWVPSTLVGSLSALADGEPMSSFLRAAAVAVVATAACLFAGIRLLARREV